MGRRPGNRGPTKYDNSLIGLVLLARVAMLNKKHSKDELMSRRSSDISNRLLSERLLRIIEWNEFKMRGEFQDYLFTDGEAMQVPIVQKTIEHMRTCNTCKCANSGCVRIRRLLIPYFWRFHHGIIKRHFAKEDIPRAIKIQMALTSINLIPKGQY